ncbi:ATP-grasp domain-containing protein [Candidatus Methylopumilus planktonicus]|uniref:ATP-grasp domain-containing protein n=1 Tax=Candidatus Methylopumilus planktonicus TaxID=1581557 RepID=UPI003BEEC0CC
MNNNILILSAGRRVELVQSFKAEISSRSLTAKLYASDSNPHLSAACNFADEFFATPLISDPTYGEFLFDLCLKHQIGLVIPTIDTDLLILSALRLKFLNEGIAIAISEGSFVEICSDKRKTANLFNLINIPSPKIYSLENLKYPCFVKPYDGSNSIGAILINTPSDLSKSLVTNKKMIFMEYIDASYVEYTIDAYYDRHEKLKCYVPRQRLAVRAGEISKGLTKRDDLYEILKDKLNLIKGARGCITIQIFVHKTENSLLGLEINPRFGGGYPLSYSAGANYSGWLIDEYLLGKEIAFFDKWEKDLMMLRYDSKVLIHAN